jgi:hypothetical protein
MTTDDDIRKAGAALEPFDRSAECWLADRAALRALVRTAPYPDCSMCQRVAMRFFSGSRGDIPVCDACEPERYRFVVDMGHAPALRAALARIAQWDRGGR